MEAQVLPSRRDTLGGGVRAGWSLRDQIFFLLRTALKDRPKGPPTANRQLPSTTNRHQPQPTASGDQLPPTMVEHMECPRAFLGKLVPEHFFFPVKDHPGAGGV